MSSGRRLALRIAAACGAVLVVAGLFFYLRTREAAGIGIAMLAKQMCSCIFVAGRGVEECRADQFSQADAVGLELLRGEGRVRTWVTGLGERSARYREGFGCTLE